jgi:hypothetical protein
MTIDPTVFVVLKNGTSYGTTDGTPLCVALKEDEARHRKIGRCVPYVPEKLFLDERTAKRTFANCLSDLVKVGRRCRDGWMSALADLHAYRKRIHEREQKARQAVEATIALLRIHSGARPTLGDRLWKLADQLEAAIQPLGQP